VIDFCRRGSPAARVMDVNVQWEDYTGEFTDFHIRYRGF
jgi:acylphosphatase